MFKNFHYIIKLKTQMGLKKGATNETTTNLRDLCVEQEQKRLNQIKKPFIQYLATYEIKHWLVSTLKFLIRVQISDEDRLSVFFLLMSLFFRRTFSSIKELFLYFFIFISAQFLATSISIHCTFAPDCTQLKYIFLQQTLVLVFTC